MSDSKSTPDWPNDWQALQRQYWNAWSDLTRAQTASAAPDVSTPWHEGLEQWSRMFGGAGKQSDAAERMMSGAKNYLTLMQSMLSFAAGKDPSAINAPSWLDAMRGGMNMPGFGSAPGMMPGMMPGFDAAMLKNLPGFDPSMFASMPGFDPAMFANMPGLDASLFNNPMAKALREISGQGVKGLEQLAAGAAPMLQQMQAEGMSWLKAPAFGYAREHQEHYQKMAVAFVEFRQASNQYNALMMKSSQRSFEILEDKLAERSEPGRQIDSIRALYDLWVDAAEEAYAEIALSDEFRKVYGDVVNAQMRVRSQMQAEVERIGVDLGMPTRSELNSVHKRLHELRRELRNGPLAPPQESHEDVITQLRAEVDELKRLVINSAAAAKPTARKSRTAQAAAKSATKAAPKAAPKAPNEPAARASNVVKLPAPGKRAATAAVPARNARGAKRRATRHAVRAVATTPKATRPTGNEPAASFGDAIAAIRQQVAPVAGKKKKRKASAMFQPLKQSPLSVRANPRKSGRSK